MMNRSDFQRDPLRFVLMCTLHSRGVVLLFGGILICFYGLSLTLCNAMEGAPIIALIGTLSVALLMLFSWKAIDFKKQPIIVLLCLAGLSMLAVGAQLSMLDIKPGRFTKVLNPMLDDMWNYGLVSAMAWEDGAWSGVYLFFMALLSRVENFSRLYAIKLFGLLCQCLAAGAVVKLALLRGTTRKGALVSLFASVLLPSMLMNTGLWAQSDALFACLTLWGLFFLLDDHPAWGSIFWGLALGTKLQSAFLFPLLIVLFMKNRFQIRHFFVLTLTAFLSQIAILLDGQGMMALISRYAAQLEIVRDEVGLSDCMPNVYQLMKVASVREFSGMGLYLGIACALLVVAALLRARCPLTPDTLLLASLLLACGLPLVLPQMNARSLYLAGLLAWAVACTPRRIAVACILEFISLCAYMASIFHHEVMPMLPLALLAIGVAVAVLLDMLPALLSPEEAEHV